jgi:hypothetical protein
MNNRKELSIEEQFKDAPDYIKEGLKNRFNNNPPPPPPPPTIYPEPTLKDKIHSLLDFAKNVARDGIEGKKVIALEETFKKRMDKCISCEFISEDKSTCNACGCILQAKLRFESASCPKGYW